MAIKWSDVLAKKFPEIITVRFPAGTKEKINALAKAEGERLEQGDEDALLVNESIIVRKAVLQFLEDQGR